MRCHCGSDKFIRVLEVTGTEVQEVEWVECEPEDGGEAGYWEVVKTRGPENITSNTYSIECGNGHIFTSDGEEVVF